MYGSLQRQQVDAAASQLPKKHQGIMKAAVEDARELRPRHTANEVRVHAWAVAALLSLRTCVRVCADT